MQPPADSPIQAQQLQQGGQPTPQQLQLHMQQRQQQQASQQPVENSPQPQQTTSVPQQLQQTGVSSQNSPVSQQTSLQPLQQVEFNSGMIVLVVFRCSDVEIIFRLLLLEVRMWTPVYPLVMDLCSLSLSLLLVLLVLYRLLAYQVLFLNNRSTILPLCVWLAKKQFKKSCQSFRKRL